MVNASAQDLDLAGWSILDRDKRRLVLEGGLLASGDAVRIHLGPPVALAALDPIGADRRPAALR